MPHRIEAFYSFVERLGFAMIGGGLMGWSYFFLDPFWFCVAVVAGGCAFGWATIVYEGKKWMRGKVFAAIALSGAASLIMVLSAWSTLFARNPTFLAMLGLLAGTTGPPMLAAYRKRFLKLNDDGDDRNPSTRLACSDQRTNDDDES